jgi:hypothetical protein
MIASSMISNCQFVGGQFGIEVERPEELVP